MQLEAKPDEGGRPLIVIRERHDVLDFSWLPGPIASLVQRILNAIKRRLKLDVLTLGLPALVLLFGFVGFWLLDFNGTFHSFTKVIIETLGSFKTSVNDEKHTNVFTDTATILASVFLYSWFFALLYTTVRETGEKALVRLFTSNHIVIVGDTDFATTADTLWRKVGRHPLRIISADKPPPPDWRSRRIRAAFDDTLVGGFAVHRAKHVLIDLGDDMKTLTLAFKMLSGVAEQNKGHCREAEWIIVVRNAALADHFATKVRGLPCACAKNAPPPSLHYLHPERLAARFFMAEHPLFLLAEKQQQRCVHALIVGSAPIGRHLIEMTFLAPLTAGLERPAVTVLTPHADAERNAFFSGRPALADAVDIAFIDVGALDAFEPHDGDAASRLDAREAKIPFTAAFLIAEDSQENLRVALLLSRTRRKMPRLDCKIFSYEESITDVEFLSESESFTKSIGGFEVFGLSDAYLTQEICDADKRDLLARALHERYRRNATKPVATWNELEESYRRANRNAADHWLAKMHMLGFAVDAIKAGALAKLSEADADALLKQPVEAGADGHVSDVAAAVRCEHDRWMIERLLDGWSPGPERIEERRVHNLLVQWEELERDFPGEIAKDADQVEATIECLVQYGDPQFVLKRRDVEEQAPKVAA